MTKTLVLTGGSSGIGAAIAQAFVDAGYQVFNLDIKAGEYGQHIACDVTRKESVDAAVAKLVSNHTIDVCISNAGMHFSGTIEQTSEADFMRVFDLNVKGAYYLTQAVLPSMKAANNGLVLYIGSDQSIIAKPNSFAYNLSKHALASMAKTTALDFADYNIRANALCPGTIDTPLYQKAIAAYCAKSGANINEVHQQEANLQPLGRIGYAREVAAYALFLASDSAAFITGSLPVIDGGYTVQ